MTIASTACRGNASHHTAHRSLAALILLAAVELHAQAPALWAGLTPGRFHVGYLHTTAGSQTVDVWYPANNDGTRMRFRTYLHGRGEELERFLTGQGIAHEAVAAFVDGAVYSRAEATAAGGTHGLVLIAQGNGQDAADQAILSEYLASQGYVVASVPSPMIAHRMTAEAEIGAFAEEQQAAIERAKHVIMKQFRVRAGHVAVVGHSFGARAALLVAMRDPSIRAIVSLDGGIGTATGIAYLEGAPSFNRNARLPPLLHVYEVLDSFMRPDFRFLENLQFRELKLQQTNGMHHIHFTTYGFAAVAVPDIAKATKAGSQVRENVVTTAQSVLAFIDRQLRR